MMNRYMILTLILLQALVVGLYLSEMLLVILLLVGMMGVTLIRGSRMILTVIGTSNKMNQPSERVLARLRFSLFYYMKMTRKLQLRSMFFLALLLFLLFHGIFSLSIMGREVQTRVTDAAYPYGHFIDVITKEHPFLTGPARPDFSKTVTDLIKEIEVNITSWASSSDALVKRVMTREKLLTITIVNAQALIGNETSSIPIAASVDIIVLPDDHWIWKQLELEGAISNDILQHNFISLNLVSIKDRPEEGLSYLDRYGFDPQKVLPFNITDMTNTVSVQVNDSNLHVTEESYSFRDIRLLLDQIGVMQVGIPVSMQSLLFASRSFFESLFRDFPHNSAFTDIHVILETWFSFKERDSNANDFIGLGKNKLVMLEDAFYQWGLHYYQEKGLRELYQVEEKIKIQPFFVQLVDAKIRMNNTFILSALVFVVIIVLTGFIIHTEFTTFSSEEKWEIIRKLVLRGLSMKKHVPYIIVTERVVLFCGSLTIALFFISILTTLGTVGHSFFTTQIFFLSLLTWQQVLDTFTNARNTVLSFTAAVIQVYIVMIILHQNSFYSVLRKRAFLLSSGGSSNLITSSSSVSLQPSRSSLEEKKVSKYQVAFHVIGLILILLLTEIRNWLEQATDVTPVATFTLRGLVFFVSLWLVTSIFFTYHPRILAHIGHRLSRSRRTASFMIRHVVMRICSERPPVQLRLLTFLILTVTLSSVTYLNIQKDMNDALVNSFMTVGADLRLEGIDVDNTSIINQIKALKDVKTVSSLHFAMISPLGDSHVSYVLIGLNMDSFQHILQDKKDLVPPEIAALVSSLKEKANSLIGNDVNVAINLSLPIPALVHQELQSLVSMDVGARIILRIPSYESVGPQRYDISLEIINFFKEFPGINELSESSTSSMSSSELKIPIIIPQPFFEVIMNATSLPTSYQGEFLLMTMKEETRINEVVNTLNSMFESNPLFSLEKRLTSNELSLKLYQLDIHESVRINLMLLFQALVILGTSGLMFILHFRQWANHHENLALLFGATSRTLKREYSFELSFHLLTVALSSMIFSVFLDILDTGITNLTMSYLSRQLFAALTVIIAMISSVGLLSILFILTHKIKMTKVSLPRFTN